MPDGAQDILTGLVRGDSRARGGISRVTSPHNGILQIVTGRSDSAAAIGLERKVSSFPA